MSGCVSPYKSIFENPAKLREELVDTYGFAFLHEGNEYFFAPHQFKQDGRECDLYLGYKNNKLEYAFPIGVFYTIQKDYAVNDEPNKIKKLIVENVQQYPPTEKRCHEFGQGPPPDAGQGEGILIFLFPITVPIFTVVKIKEYKDNLRLRAIAQNVKLGMKESEVLGFFKGKWTKKWKGKFPYYEIRDSRLQMILYFEQGKLNAWSQNYIY